MTLWRKYVKQMAERPTSYDSPQGQILFKNLGP